MSKKYTHLLRISLKRKPLLRKAKDSNISAMEISTRVNTWTISLMAMDITSGETKMGISVNSSKGTGKAVASGRAKTVRNFKESIKLTSEVDMECTSGLMAIFMKENLRTITGMELARWAGQMAKHIWGNGRTAFSMARVRSELAFLLAICNLNYSFKTESQHQARKNRQSQRLAQKLDSCYLQTYLRQINFRRDYQWTRE